jgi:deoxyhypusine synthase
MKQTTHYEENFRFMRKCTTLDGYPEINGHDFEKKQNFDSFLKGFTGTGFQATNLGYGIQITNRMISDKAKIIISMTGNAVSSGVRDIITYLVKNKKIHAIVTTAAGVEEDLIKCFKPFVVGDFDAPGKMLFDSGVGRIGNIFAPFDRYVYFEKFIDPLLAEIYKKKNMSVSEFIKELGLKINNKESYIYWAAKNSIPIYCPAIHDGSIGDLFYFFKRNHPDFSLDFFSDQKKLIDYCLNEEKIGAIILGGGIAKHFLLNSNILREGLDYAVYITTAQEFDGSDSGGNQEEAKTWAKIKVDAQSVKIKCDFTIAFPILVAGSFAKK